MIYVVIVRDKNGDNLTVFTSKVKALEAYKAAVLYQYDSAKFLFAGFPDIDKYLDLLASEEY